MRHAEYPAPERVLLHLSDTHLRAAGSRLFDLVDATARLRRALDAIEASGIAPDAHRVHRRPRRPRRGRRLRRAARDRRAVRGTAGDPRVLGDGQPRRSRRLPLAAARRARRPTRCDRSTASTSSTACGSSPSTRPFPGSITASCATSSSRGWPRCSRRPRRSARSSRCTTRRCRACCRWPRRVELRDQARLADVLRGTDVRAIIAGHLHYSTFATFAGIPVSVASVDLLRAGPHRAGRRHAAAGRRAGVQSRPRLRPARSCTRSSRSTRRARSSTSSRPRRGAACAARGARIAPLSAARTDAPTEPIGVLR